MTATVSVVMPMYDSARTVAAAVSSVLWQTYERLELVVVDDGSNDGSAALVAAFRDSRLRLVRQANAGAAAARNRGLAEASGELVSFVDSDDLLLPKHLEALVDTWQAAGAGAVATANAYFLLPGGISSSKVRHRGRFPAPAQQRLALLQQNFVSPMSLLSRSVLDAIGTFDTTLARNEDWDLWLRAVFSGHPVVHQPRPLALYNWSGTGLSTDLDLVFADEDVILRRMARRRDLAPEERRYLERRLGSVPPRQLAIKGDVELRAGRYRQAGQNYAAAAALCPAERMLVRKARLLNVAPLIIGPALRRRQVRGEAALGLESHSIR
jgi:glycosyltransferase involved in cell wall biosynthesis